MRLSLTDTGVRATGIDWWADWVSTRTPFRGSPVFVLDPTRTAGATLTQHDVAYYAKHGRWPGYDRLALDPSWGFPFPAADMTADRREFHQWRTTAWGFPGRKLTLDYEAAREVRQLRVYSAVVREFPRLPAVTYENFRLIAKGIHYWWVQAGDPNWMGWHWTYEPEPETVDA